VEGTVGKELSKRWPETASTHSFKKLHLKLENSCVSDSMVLGWAGGVLPGWEWAFWEACANGITLEKHTFKKAELLMMTLIMVEQQVIMTIPGESSECPLQISQDLQQILVAGQGSRGTWVFIQKSSSFASSPLGNVPLHFLFCIYGKSDFQLCFCGSRLHKRSQGYLNTKRMKSKTVWALWDSPLPCPNEAFWPWTCLTLWGWTGEPWMAQDETEIKKFSTLVTNFRKVGHVPTLNDSLSLLLFFLMFLISFFSLLQKPHIHNRAFKKHSQ
jgi:hypothetical protein